MQLTPTDEGPSSDRREPVTGNYFVSTYPPFSCWSREWAGAAQLALATHYRSIESVPLGLYIHVPFCSQRCDFCYYRSNAKTSRSEMREYSAALLKEIELYRAVPLAKERELDFVYFGGGTPSLLPEEELQFLVRGIQRHFSWGAAREVTFECAPKTATAEKLSFLRDAGVTRISMGVQQMNDAVLKANGRIHRVADVMRAYSTIRRQAFPVVNLDLIVGLLGETDKTFFDSLDEVIALGPDSITIYQLEIPPNTPLYRSQAAGSLETPLVSWECKRKRLGEAFQRLESAGWTIRSAYAAVRSPAKTPFVYQDAQYEGADLFGSGLASFSYAQGVHYQNTASLGTYQARLAEGCLPIDRGYPLGIDERLIRQFILQLKLGSVSVDRFLDEFGVDIIERFAEPLARLTGQGLVEVESGAIRLTAAGLLCADRLLPEFYQPAHQGISYW